MKRFALAVFAAVLLFAGQSCTQISPTEAGFRINNTGDYRGLDSLPLLTGICWYKPYSSIVTIPCTMQHKVWTEDVNEGSDKNEEIRISVMGGAGFKMDVGINFYVIRERASSLYLKYKTGDLDVISTTYLRNIVRGTMQDVAGTMTVDTLLNDRPHFEHLCDSILIGRFKAMGFVLDNFSIINSPRPADSSLAAAIAAKITAKQTAERTKTEEQTSIAQANKDIAKARGDSASSVIRASGEAAAVKLLQNVMTPEYVEYIKWLHADGSVPRVPETVLASGSYIYSPKK